METLLVETLLIVEPKEAQIAPGFKVKRVLPFRGGRMIGPFAFLDHMGPLTIGLGSDGDVPPHPHIGLSTLTYLTEGSVLHRDSLGSVQEIRPGEVNWMTAGSGIVHSERLPGSVRERGGQLSGLQFWVALPRHLESSEPSFQHVKAEAIPDFEVSGCRLRLIAGSAFERTSPVQVYSPLFLVEANISAQRLLEFSPQPGHETAFYLASGEIQVGTQLVRSPNLFVFPREESVRLEAAGNSYGFLLGGAPFEEHRTIWWNFVASSRETIEAAKVRWKNQEFPKIPGEQGFVPLPG